MKQPLLFVAIFLLSVIASAQQTNVHQIELSISTPQPRLGQEFLVFINFDPIKADLAKALGGNVRQANENSSLHCDAMDMVMLPNEKGKQSIGPLEFSYNGETYRTNKVEFEVIDALPDVAEGVWMRKVETDASMMSVIIEQRMLTQDKNKVIQLKGDSLPAGCSLSDTDSRFYNDNVSSTGGSTAECYMYYVIYTFKITDTSKQLVLTKENFTNLPVNFQFTDIVLN